MSNIIILDPKLWKIGYESLPYNNKGNEYPKTLKQWCEDLKADVVWNLAAFNPASYKNIINQCAGRTIHYLKARGTERGYGSESTKITVGPDANNQVSGYTHISSGVCVIDNVIQKGISTCKTARNLHGITSTGKYIIVQTESCTEAVACRAAINRANQIGEKIKLLLTEDGGGSVGQYSRLTKMMYAPKKEGSDGRKVASVVYANYIGPEIKGDFVYERGNVRKGEDVGVIQTLLCCDPDQSYGPGTATSAKTSQYRLCINPTGAIDNKTLMTIFR